MNFSSATEVEDAVREHLSFDSGRLREPDFPLWNGGMVLVAVKESAGANKGSLIALVTKFHTP